MGEKMTEERLAEILDTWNIDDGSSDKFGAACDAAQDALNELAAEVRRCWMEINNLKTDLAATKKLNEKLLKNSGVRIQ